MEGDGEPERQCSDCDFSRPLTVDPCVCVCCGRSADVDGFKYRTLISGAIDARHLHASDGISVEWFWIFCD